MKLFKFLFFVTTVFLGQLVMAINPNHSIEAITNHGIFYYSIDNTGEVDVAGDLQAIFDELSALEDVSATISFSPGIYYINTPVSLSIAGVKLIGNGHGGIDVHGANLATGTIFRLGKNCAPYCITFNYAGRTKSFPAGETPWPNKNLKVEIENIAFVGYNNTGVNTAEGYSRWRKDEPNFRGLKWYPEAGRYGNVEKEGQRAIYLPPSPKVESWGWAKCELLRVTGCYFTELYVGIDASWTDVSYIDKNWFGQLTYAIRLSGPGMMVNNNLFADLETALKIGDTKFSSFSNNSFAYVSKCFEFSYVSSSTIIGNTLENMTSNKGSSGSGSFIYVGKSYALNVLGNSIVHPHDSRKKSLTIDDNPNGQSFIQFDNSNHLIFSNNNIITPLNQTVVRLHNCSNSIITNNIIKYGEQGNAVAETGDSQNNFYKTINIKNSDSFDVYKY